MCALFALKGLCSFKEKSIILLEQKVCVCYGFMERYRNSVLIYEDEERNDYFVSGLTLSHSIVKWFTWT